MPQLTEYRPAEIFMEHEGVTIYHVYKDDDLDQGMREFWFDIKEDSRDDDSFDVRELADALGPSFERVVSEQDDDEAKMVVLRAAIEQGLVKRSLKRTSRRSFGR